MKFLIAVATLLGGLLLFASPASAHATVVTSTPSDGQRLKAAPASVSIKFDEQVGIGTFGYLHVTDAAGARVESGAAVHPDGDSTTVTVTLRAGLGDGTYTESYRVVSADSHPVSGVVRFVVGPGPLTAPTVTAGGTDGGVAVALDVIRWVSYVGFALLGGGWLLLTVWSAGRDDHRARRIVWTGWGLAGVGAVLEVLLEGAYGAGSALSSAVKPSLIDATLHADYGQLHSARLVLLGLVAVVLGLALQPGRKRSRLDDAFWPLGVGVAYTFAAVGHAKTTSPAWVSIAADTLHLCAMATWVGGLVLLIGAVLPRRSAGELADVLPAFSRTAFVAVVTLAVTGTYAAWRGIGSWRAVFGTEYGLLVGAKVVLFVGLLALGNLSRQVIQQRVRRPVVAYAMTSAVSESDVDEHEPAGLDAVTTERMRRAVLVEVVLAAIVLAVTAVLVSQPRGSEALATDDRAPVTATAPLGGGSSASVTVDPGEHGTVGVAVTVQGGAVPQSVTGTATQPARQLGPIPLKLTADGPGHYTSSAVSLPVAGRWVIALVVTSSQFAAVSADVAITLK